MKLALASSCHIGVIEFSGPDGGSGGQIETVVQRTTKPAEKTIVESMLYQANDMQPAR